MIIDFLTNNNANYHEKQLSYLKAASHKAVVVIMEKETNFKENLRDDTWDDNHQD